MADFDFEARFDRVHARVDELFALVAAGLRPVEDLDAVEALLPRVGDSYPDIASAVLRDELDVNSVDDLAALPPFEDDADD